MTKWGSVRYLSKKPRDGDAFCKSFCQQAHEVRRSTNMLATERLLRFYDWGLSHPGLKTRNSLVTAPTGSLN